MPNPYFTTIAPYFAQQDQSLNPVFQNIAAQQANQNAALQQQNQQVAQAGQVQGGGGGMNPLAMAMMLRGKSSAPATYTGPSYGTNPNFSNSHFDTMSYD